MHEYAQRLQLECSDKGASTIDVQWLSDFRHLLPMVRRELAHKLLYDPEEAAIYLLGELRGGDAKKVQAVLGVSPRSLRSWVDNDTKPRGLELERLVLVAQVTADLGREMDRDEMLDWFLTPGKHAPVDLINSDIQIASPQLLAASAAMGITI